MTVASRCKIREAEPDDWAAIARLLYRPAAEAAGLRRWVINEYEAPVTLVAQDSTGGVVGAVAGGIPRGEGQRAQTGEGELAARLSYVGVAPAHRRRGLATRLLDSFFDELRARQARRITLLVEGTQVEALALFRRLGFETDGQQLSLVRPSGDFLPRGGVPATIRPLALGDLPLLTGLLIRLGVERAREPHDTLDALTPAQLEGWLQRTGTVAYAAWAPDDERTALGLAWATRRQEDGVLRFIGVDDEQRRHGIGSALLARIVESVADRPLRTALEDPGDEADFFRAAGFQVERVTHRMSKTLA
jgi:ribosomal-protein-alanine N-acetyltransferase